MQFYTHHNIKKIVIKQNNVISTNKRLGPGIHMQYGFGKYSLFNNKIYNKKKNVKGEFTRRMPRNPTQISFNENKDKWDKKEEIIYW